ncbi:hypothetical protein [Kordiimonas sp.]|uniref:hypothetical protein n=1 Tax=Kordiimonas sp. TaxID=1970157 RepID=UPI003A912988
MMKFLFLLCALLGTAVHAQQGNTYLKWNIDHTQRTPRPAYPLTTEQAAIIDHYSLAYDPQGRLTQVTFFHEGQPSPAGDFGAAILTFAYAADKTVEAYQDVGGEPVAVNGVLRKIYHHGPSGFWDRLTFETEDGTDMTGDGYSEVHVTRDSEGRVVTETRFDKNGNIVPEHNGFDRASFAYDANDMALYRRFENADGTLKNGRLGYAGVFFEFDQYGNFLNEEARDTSGSLAPMSAGFSRIEWRDFNSFGKPARVNYFDAESRPYAPYAFSTRTYTQTMQRDSVAYFDQHSLPAMHPAGFHRVEYHYGEGGVIERKLFDADGIPVTSR